MPVVVVTPPAQIIDLTLAKQHLRVDASFTDDDDLIDVYSAAAQAMIDGPFGWLGRCIGKQTLELRLDSFPTPIWGWVYGGGGLFWGSMPSSGDDGCGWPSGRTHRIRLPYPPLVSVSSVTYEDSTGTEQELPSADYLAADNGISASYGTTFPNGRIEADAVKIQYIAGYDAVPAPITAALLLMIGDLYSNRETAQTGVRAAAVVVPMSTTVEALLAPYRVFG